MDMGTEEGNMLLVMGSIVIVEVRPTLMEQCCAKRSDKFLNIMIDNDKDKEMHAA
jgi:hypothetical protein